MDKQESLNKAIIEQKKAISRLCASQDMCKNMLLFAYEKEAIKKHGNIYPCCNNEQGISFELLADCFTEMNDCIYFWFNDRLGSTHLEKCPCK
jgi:hypothetical protein